MVIGIMFLVYNGWGWSGVRDKDEYWWYLLMYVSVLGFIEGCEEV